MNVESPGAPGMVSASDKRWAVLRAKSQTWSAHPICITESGMSGFQKIRHNTWEELPLPPRSESQRQTKPAKILVQNGINRNPIASINKEFRAAPRAFNFRITTMIVHEFRKLVPFEIP